ncbi:MAG: DUF59 domain-containing protein [Planctomycetes bacterium]|nr:DUF59 domain-containing protein [Planctomycetota bacterium]
MTHQEVTLTRDCEGIQIPAGDKVALKAGMRAMITQALGGTFTLMTDRGYLVRLDGKDADAIGQKSDAAAATGVVGAACATAAAHASPADPAAVEALAWNQMKTVYDPEIPANVVDLGLVYVLKAASLADGGHRVDVQMTLTAPGCGMGDILKADAERKLRAVPGVKEVSVELVLEPVWDPSRMSESARLQLGMF